LFVLGTGKTTVARTIAKILFNLKLKPSDKVIERAALDLVADYVGQTKTRVHKTLADAKGGCLFVDEAYNLGEGQFGKEACDTVVAAMTSEEYQNVTIIFAGYAAEVDDMFRTNSGLKSRFTHFFEFPDWTVDDCVAFFAICANKEKFLPLDNNLTGILRGGFEILLSLEGWANGRDVKRLWDESKSQRAYRVFDEPESEKALIDSDVQQAVASMIKSRAPKTRKSNTSTRRRHNFPATFPPTQRPDVMPNEEKTPSEERLPENTDEATLVEESVEFDETMVDDENANEDEKDVSSEPHHDDDDPDGDLKNKDDDNSNLRDDGVPDEIWEELEESKGREREEADRLSLIQDELEEIVRQEHARNEEIKRLKEEMKRQMEELARLAAEEENTKKREEEARRILEEIKRKEELARLKAEAEERKRREAEARRIALELKRKEEFERKQKEEDEMRRCLLEEEENAIRKREEIKRRLRRISPCPAGFQWHQVEGGWRCGGGTHFVSNEQLQRDFGHDI